MKRKSIQGFGLIFAVVAGMAVCAVQAVPETWLPSAGFLLERDAVVAASANVTAACFPDADRVLVDNRVRETYEPDGTSVLWDDEYSKILTEKGRRDATTYTVHFNANYGTSFVHRVEIIKPDGRVVGIDVAGQSRVMTEPGQMGSNIYDPANKILSVSLSGLEIGDLCHVVTCRIVTKARMSDTWADYAVFEYDLPILKLDYEISAPAGLPIRHKMMRAPVADTVAYTESRESDGRTLHTWKIRDVPQMFPEPDMPPMHTQVQRLLLSTTEDWPTVSRWYWKLCEPALDKITPEIRAKVSELIEGAETRDEKIRRIFKFVSQQIRYMGITTEDTAPGYEPHEVSLTFNNRYGVCRDKAALLVAMLRLADIPAYPVLIHAGAKMDPDVPVPFFNHAITAVDKPGGGYILMDSTDENTRDLFPAYLCNRSYLVAKPDGETLLVSDVYSAEKNMTRITTDGTLDANGTLLFTSRIVLEGINDNVYRGHFMRQKTEQRRKFFEGQIKRRLAGAEVIACEITPADLQDTEKTLAIALTVRVPDFPVRGDGLDMATLPWLGTTFGYANFVIGQTGLKERRYTLETGITCGIEERVSLRVVDALGAAHALPNPVRIERGGVRFERTHAFADGVLSGDTRYLIETPEFSPAEYLELKKTLEEMEASNRARPLFEAFPTVSPDHEMLSDVTDTLLHTPDAWTTTRTWSKRILTYAGKKNGAELKIGYNPVWQNVEVLEATVSNLNGTVHAVTPKEMNVMDAAWAGDAPRYPAGKTLVVNFPGVETGSVITVTTRFSQTNAWFYSNARSFGGFEPVQSETYRLRYPKTLKPSIQTFQADRLTHTAVTNGSEVVLEWHAPAQPPVRVEELLPPWHFFEPSVFVSFGDWRSHARKLRHAVDAAADEDSAARRRAKELVKGIRDPKAKLLAVRDEVLRTIRPAGPSFLKLPPDTFSSPDRTLADQYGHPADRAILLAAMLDAAGFDAEILFASDDTTRYPAHSQPSRDVPQDDYFAYPLVRVKHKGATYILNEGDQYDELGASGADGALALTLRGKIVSVDIAEPLQNRSRNECSIELDETGMARLTFTNWFFGTAAGPFRKQYKEMLPEDLRRHHLELVGAVARSAEAASELTVETAAYPAYRTFSVTARDYAVVENGTLTLMIPDVAGAVFPLRGDTRVNPLFMGATDESELSCRVTLPPGFTRMQLIPESKRWTLPGGFGTLDYSVEQSVRDDGRVEVRITRHVKRHSGEVPPELYPALLEYNRRLTHPSVRTLVVEKLESEHVKR